MSSRITCIKWLTILTFVASACTPGSDIANVGPDTISESQYRVPVYRSEKQISSDCGVVRTMDIGPPGFAPVSGGTVGDLPPPLAHALSIGSERTEVETDFTRVAPGYVFLETFTGTSSLLVDVNKEVVATIENDYFVLQSKFDAAGNRTAGLIINSAFRSGVSNGCLEEYSSDGEFRWRMKLASEDYLQHHDFHRMENGNILAVVWERANKDETIDQGRDPEKVSESGDNWYDGVIEINPYTLEIVWEWSSRHHLIQDFDPAKRNYGVVEDHPELIDMNKIEPQQDGEISEDWMHVNAIDYNADLDQIVLSSYSFSEFWIIDHSTTPWESMGHSGGRQNKGGDLLYRWGNPANYNQGNEDDQVLYHQHDVQWIRDGLPGAGNILIFNNGLDGQREYSTVVELTPEMNSDGSYDLGFNGTYGPVNLAWEYNPDPPEQYYSPFISSVQRLPNGNTLINAGAGAKIREVTPEGEIVWDYFYKGEFDAPYTIFRARKYPLDNPGIVALLGRSAQVPVSED